MIADIPNESYQAVFLDYLAICKREIELLGVCQIYPALRAAFYPVNPGLIWRSSSCFLHFKIGAKEVDHLGKF